MLDAVCDRLKAEVEEFGERIEQAAEFTAMVREKRFPQVTPAAFVLPVGLRGERADASAGVFTQNLAETIAVVMVFSAHDRTGERALNRLNDFLREVIAVIAGWAPDGVTGVFQVSRGAVSSFQDGRLVYQLEFSIIDQLRLFP